MSAFAKRWRDWATLLIGGYLLFSPWIFGASGDEASSANAWVIGACAAAAALWALLEAGPRAIELARVGIGVWLLVSPFALGFAGSVMAWNAWIAGVLMVTLTDLPNLYFDLQSWLQAKRLNYQARDLAGEHRRLRGPRGYRGPRAPERADRRVRVPDLPYAARTSLRTGGRYVRPGIPGLRERHVHTRPPLR